MNDLANLGRGLIIVGLALAAIGLAVLLGVRLSWWSWLGRLPGNFVIRRGPITIYIPLLASIVLSLLATLILRFFVRR